MAYMLILISMTLTSMQGHSGLAEETKFALNYLDNQASNKHAGLNSVFFFFFFFFFFFIFFFFFFFWIEMKVLNETNTE